MAPVPGVIRRSARHGLVATLAVLVICGAGRRAARPPAADTKAPRQFELVWADEFDRDGPPDSSKWTYEHGFVRNEELQWYRPENARVEHGQLIIEARRERIANPAFDSTSRSWRAHRFEIDYVRVYRSTTDRGSGQR